MDLCNGQRPRFSLVVEDGSGSPRLPRLAQTDENENDCGDQYFTWTSNRLRIEYIKGAPKIEVSKIGLEDWKRAIIHAYFIESLPNTVVAGLVAAAILGGIHGQESIQSPME